MTYTTREDNQQTTPTEIKTELKLSSPINTLEVPRSYRFGVGASVRHKGLNTHLITTNSCNQSPTRDPEDTVHGNEGSWLYSHVFVSTAPSGANVTYIPTTCLCFFSCRLYRRFYVLIQNLYSLKRKITCHVHS